MNASNVTFRLFAITLVAAATTAVVGCAADATSTPSSAPKQASTSVEAGADASAHGVARYSVSVADQLTNVALLDAKGAQLGSIVSYGIDGGRHVSYSHGSVDIELEYQKGTLSAWVNGHSRGTQPLDPAAVSSGKGATSVVDLSEVSDDASTFFTVSADPSLQQAITGLRGAESPYMFGLKSCPGYTWVGCAVGIGTPVGAAVCTYCAIAWL